MVMITNNACSLHLVRVTFIFYPGLYIYIYSTIKSHSRLFLSKHVGIMLLLSVQFIVFKIISKKQLATIEVTMVSCE